MKTPRKRPHIQANNNYVRQDEHRMCANHHKGCRNVVAVWTSQRYCTPCREAGAR